MTKGCKILSIELPEDVLYQLTSEAQAPPFLGNRSKYARGILEQRHQKTVVISPPAQAQADHYKQQLAQQEQQHQQRLDERLQAHEQQLFQQARDFQQQLDEQAHFHAQQREAQDERHQQQLDRQAQRLEERNQELLKLQGALVEQQQTYNELQTSYVELALKQAKTEFDQAVDTKERAKQTEKLEALTQAHEALQGKYKDARNSQQWFELTTTFIEKHPDVLQAGLTNLLGGKATKPTATKPPTATPAPTEPTTVAPAATEPSAATKLGERIIKDFPGPAFKPMTEILCYLRDIPQAKARLLAQPEFVAYQTKLRAKAAGENHK